MLLGNFRTYSEVSAPPPTPYRSTQWDAFVSDNWKLHRRFSIEYGARYTYLGALYSLNNNIATFDALRYNPARAVTVNRDGTLVANTGDLLNGLVKAGVDGPRGNFESPHRVAPRFSFAYAPFNHNRTAVRGGFGVFYNIWRGDITQRTSENPPFTQQAQYENQNLSSLSRAALVPYGNLITADPRLVSTYTMNYSLSVQQELRQGIFVEAAYVGSQGRHLLRRPDINQPSFNDLRANAALPAAQRAATNFLRPFKGYAAIQQYTSDSNSNYNALQLHATKRKGKAVFTVSYTWSKALTDASGFDEAPEDFRNRRFALREQWRLQFQADFFNLFNKANFLNVATNVSNIDFGTITSAAPGRNVQLAVRLTF
jgi:hypothetical protein